MKNEIIILASSSPRRIEMMKNYGINPIIIKPECEEILPPDISMQDAVMFLSLKKALEVERLIQSSPSAPMTFSNSNSGSPAVLDLPSELKGSFAKSPYIIAADTVVYDDKIIGKPRDREDAYNILSSLRGKMHYVSTGVTILKAGKHIRRSFYEVSKVFFKDFTDAQLCEYLDTDEPYDKAGAYAVQGIFKQYIDHIEGDLDNIIGFPFSKIIQEFSYLKKL